MDRHILLTTDLSKESERAFLPVRNLARMIDAEVTLLHVIQTLTRTAPRGTPVADPELEETSAHRALEKQAEQLGDDVEVHLKLLTSPDVPNAVIDYAKEIGAGLIALSTHGGTGLRRMLVGSVAEAILRESSVPVLVFPPPEDEAADGSSARERE